MTRSQELALRHGLLTLRLRAIAPTQGLLEHDTLTASLGAVTTAPVRISGAVDAAALAKARIGAGQGKGTSPLIYVHLGREVLCAMVYNGEPLLGVAGQEGQIGHWRVSEGGPRCACGQMGHLNPLCSSQGFVRMAIGLVSQDDSALEAASAVSNGRVEALTAQRVVELASAGVEPLRELVLNAGDALGVALAQLTLLVDPVVIVLGGPLGVTGGLFLDEVQKRLAANLRSITSSFRTPEIVPARLEPLSALNGAWLLAREVAEGK